MGPGKEGLTGGGMHKLVTGAKKTNSLACRQAGSELTEERSKNPSGGRRIAIHIN